MKTLVEIGYSLSASLFAFTGWVMFNEGAGFSVVFPIIAVVDSINRLRKA